MSNAPQPPDALGERLRHLPGPVPPGLIARAQLAAASQLPPPSPTSPRRRILEGVLAVAVAAAIAVPLYVTHTGGANPTAGGSNASVQLVFYSNNTGSGCNGTSATPAAVPTADAIPLTPGVIYGFCFQDQTALPLSGGTMSPLPAEPIAGWSGGGVLLGDSPQVEVVGAFEGLELRDLYVDRLPAGGWSEVTLSQPVTWSSSVGIGGGELSPDGRQLSVVFDSQGDIAVMDLASGSVHLLSAHANPSAPVQTNLWLADGIHVTAACPGDPSTNCGYVVDPTTGARTRRSDEDRNPTIVGSPDGTQEAVASDLDAAGSGQAVLAGPAAGSLSTVYTAPSGDWVSPLGVADDGTVLVMIGRQQGSQDGAVSAELLVGAGGGATAVTAPPEGWDPSGIEPDFATALPGGGFVDLLWTGASNPGPDVQELVYVMPEGSTSVITSVPETTAEYLGPSW
jgi:hypothetical protein